MLAKLIAVSKHLDYLAHQARKARDRGYGPQTCELEHKLMGEALEHVLAQMSQAEHDLSEIRKLYR